MILVLPLLFLCIPAAKKKSSDQMGPSVPVTPSRTQASKTDRLQSSSDNNNNNNNNNARTDVALPMASSSNGAESPSAHMKVHLNMPPAPPSTQSSSITPKLQPPINPRAASQKLEDDANLMAVSHTGARVRGPPEKIDAASGNGSDQPSSRSDRSDQRNKAGDSRQLSWHEKKSNGESAEWIKRHFAKRGQEVPQNRPLCRLDALELERNFREREAAHEEEEEEEAKRRHSHEKKRSKKKKKKKRKGMKSRSRKSNKKKRGRGSASGGSSGTTLAGTPGEEEDKGEGHELSASYGKRKGNNKKKSNKDKTITNDNAIADPTEQAPQVTGSVSETGHRPAKDKRKKPPPPPPKRPNWSDCVPESQLPDDLTDFDHSKNSKDATKESKDKEEGEGARIPDKPQQAK